MKTALTIAALLCLLSGAAYGLHETLAHHWPAFHAKFPNADPQFWDPKISWQNKGDGWFFRTVGAVATDAKHAASTLHVWALIGGSFAMLWGGVELASRLFPNPRPPRYAKYLIWSAFFLGVVVLRALGFHTVYTMYF